MSAQRLRDAAKVLRERAEAATPGPWEWEAPSDDAWPQGDQSLVQAFVPEGKTYPESVLDGWGYDAYGISASDEDRIYIATMAPPVALALADWLEGASERHAVVNHPSVGVKCCLTCNLDLDNPDDGPHCEDMASALVIADAILGTTA